MIRARLTYLLLMIFIVTSCRKPVIETDVNKVPVANAGPDQTIMKPQDTTRLSGQLSFDPDGRIVSYQWRNLTGPNSPNMSTTVTIGGLKVYEAFVSNLKEGVYQFELTVTDNDNAVSWDTMKVTVLPDSSKMKKYIGLGWDDSCTMRIPNLSSAIPSTTGIKVFLSKYSGGGPMPVYVPPTGWYEIHTGPASWEWYEIKNDVLIIHAAPSSDCRSNGAAYDVMIMWD
ncbi:PKD domain-containing protein [Aridibaculum aurantiacum]|uniref:PKD domain-containing protein n=1 Tax=Aridibaculum aurantiacum TaxID=2810307 RepID=UPI001A973653|nr:PKD domain-containing protein [Aridibaculum aurantiacum]